jgi:hypothetical protein
MRGKRKVRRGGATWVKIASGTRETIKPRAFKKQKNPALGTYKGAISPGEKS